MNIEDLSKAQLLLLMLLVNFITSIATAVLTVSLLDQAPANVTQTVNRIVDHTIETIGTTSPLATIISPPVPAPKPVIQNNDQLLISAISAEKARMVSVYGSLGTSTPVIATGTYLPKTRAVILATQPGLPSTVTILFSDGSKQLASTSHLGATITIYGFSDTAVLPSAPTPLIIDHATLKQGQSVVALAADDSAVTGIISKVDDLGVHTNLPAIPAGSAAVDNAGNIVGISSGTAGLFLPADKITTLLTATSTPTGP
ncbi:hypothetical protein H0X32_03535 [Patescibacteria group bacterium]|nr:hypothetical protein [Patescibacteria group bacterium]